MVIKTVRINMNNNQVSGEADLHVHTSFSDGMLSPEEVVEKAIELDLRAIAITDHDSVNGILPCIAAAKGTGLEVIPGVEMSASKDDVEIHLLGYFIDPEDTILLEVFRKLQAARIKRMEKMISLLRKNVGEIDMKDVLGIEEDGTVGRLHLARAMVKKSIVRNIKKAFDRYIGDGKPCHVSHERVDYKRAIEIIQKAGGVSVLAHPAVMGKDKYIPDYVKAGLKGIEVFHSKHKLAEIRRYSELADKYGLIMTGGSDCHGMVMRGQMLMGRSNVDYEIVKELKKESESQRVRESKSRKV